MKINVNIDCTPEEARTFFGLPDVKPMQEELMREMQERMSASLKAMEPEEMLKMWLPTTLKDLERWQELVAAMTGAKRR